MSETTDIRSQLRREIGRVYRLRNTGQKASAMSLAQDLTRRSKAAGCLVSYMLAQFEVANCSESVLLPQIGCEGGIAFISLIENADLRKAFESDYSQERYEHEVVPWHVPVYHLVGSALAEVWGSNSSNMKQCVSDGMALCERIGSPYVMSFHEFAAGTYRSAGEIERALAHARLNMARRARVSDRRWVSAKSVVETLLVAGRLDAMMDAAVSAFSLGSTWHEPPAARMESAWLLQTALYCLNRLGEWPSVLATLNSGPEILRSYLQKKEEDPESHWQYDLANALAVAAGGNIAQSIDTLITWEKFLDERKCLHRWFETRLRRIAAQRMSDDSRHQAEVSALADELTRRAEPARDILSLRRLEGIFDTSRPPSLYPTYRTDRRPLILLPIADLHPDRPRLAGACMTGFSNPAETSPMAPKKENKPADSLMEQIDQVHEMRGKMLNKSAFRIADEVRHTARSQQQLIPFLGSCFAIMNISQHLLDPAMGRDAALEAIALLESPERARAFQGDYETPEYERYVQWMSACSYDNLAVAIGRMNGYNSEGMQACIADGIAVCRRTGKLRCITCFREYATEVFRAADDLAMAQHHAHANANKADIDPRNDRRWVGALDEVENALLMGDIAEASERCRKMLELAPLYHTPTNSEYKSAVTLATVLLLAGRGSEIDARTAELALNDCDAASVAPGENVEHDLARAQTQALAASIAGNHDRAIDLLSEWDRTLQNKGVLSNWFETRLRLIAAHRFAGREKNVANLARQLEDKAIPARDFLSVRRMKVLLDPAWIPCPYPAASAMTSGPFAVSKTSEPAPGATTPAPAAAAPEQKGPGPLFESINAIMAAVQTELQDAGKEKRKPNLDDSVAALLALGNGPIDDGRDAAYLMHVVLGVLFAFPDTPALWTWASNLARRFPKEAVVQSFVATLGDALRTQKDSPLAKVIKPDDLDATYRSAMAANPNHPMIFAQAAGFYLRQNDTAKAEQCLARASRLDRSDAWVAQRLAELYNRSDRGSEALTILDLCIREGNADAAVLYDAAMTATNLKRHEMAVTYLDALEKQQPNQPWVQYYRALALLDYRALALLDLGKPAEAQTAIEAEAQRVTGNTLHVACIRAAVAASVGNARALVEQLTEVLAMPLHQVKNLTGRGIGVCLGRAWTAAAALPADRADLKQALETRLLASGLITDAALLALRKLNAKTPGLQHFVCLVSQPLDGRWLNEPARLAQQEKWTGYRVRYGVLAASEDQARHLVLEMQQRCASLPAFIESIDPDPRKYNDHPGVTWRDFPVAAG